MRSPPAKSAAAGAATRSPCDLAEASARIDCLIETGADLLIINRFGKPEAEGTGLIDEIAHALSADIPVLVAVPRFRFPLWLSFCSGMGVKLPCRMECLQGWWSAMIVGEPHSPQQRQARICELLK